MKNYKTALIILAITAGAWIGFDIFLAWVKTSATISQAMSYLAGLCCTFPLIIGHLCHHWFWPHRIVIFRRLLNILNVAFLCWFGWDLFNGIIGHWSVAGSGTPSVIMFAVGFVITGRLWPQEA